MFEQGKPLLALKPYPDHFLQCLPLNDLLRGFDTSLEALLPECCGVLMSDTGYLTPTDLDEFDKVMVALPSDYCSAAKQ